MDEGVAEAVNTDDNDDAETLLLEGKDDTSIEEKATEDDDTSPSANVVAAQLDKPEDTAADDALDSDSLEARMEECLNTQGNCRRQAILALCEDVPQFVIALIRISSYKLPDAKCDGYAVCPGQWNGEFWLILVTAGISLIMITWKARIP